MRGQVLLIALSVLLELVQINYLRFFPLLGAAGKSITQRKPI